MASKFLVLMTDGENTQRWMRSHYKITCHSSQANLDNANDLVSRARTCGKRLYRPGLNTPNNYDDQLLLELLYDRTRNYPLGVFIPVECERAQRVPSALSRLVGVNLRQQRA
jgi:hypothetical protein